MLICHVFLSLILTTSEPVENRKICSKVTKGSKRISRNRKGKREKKERKGKEKRGKRKKNRNKENMRREYEIIKWQRTKIQQKNLLVSKSLVA